MNSTSRPTEWDSTWGERIVARIEEGATLKAICTPPDAPSRDTIRKWRAGELGAPESFGSEFRAARELYLERLVDEIIDLSDESLNAKDHFEVHARKLQVDSRKWIVSRLLRAEYGDRAELKHTGDPAQPVHTHRSHSFRAPTPDEQIELTAFVQQLICGGNDRAD